MFVKGQQEVCIEENHVISILLPSLGEIRLGYFGLFVIYRIVYFGMVSTWLFKYALIPVRTFFSNSDHYLINLMASHSCTGF